MSDQITDPYGNYNFKVEIQGIQRAAFHECTGLESTIDVIEHRESYKDGLHKLPGITKYANIILKWGLANDTDLYKWHLDAVNGTLVRKSGSIVVYDRASNEVARWNFRNAWPCKWKGSDFNAEGNDAAIETLELAHEGVVRQLK